MDAEQIGEEVEELLKDFLKKVGLIVSATSPAGALLPPILIPKDLRLMNSGTQHGLDLNWIIKFHNLGIEYTWYFEAKGHGYTKYNANKRKKHESFHISLISDKLLQALSYQGKDIDCWCLFAPYIKFDEADRKEIDSIREHLPFNLIIWDKDILFPLLKSIDYDLFQKIYPLDSSENPDSADQTRIVREEFLQELKSLSLEGNFWNIIHKEYWAIRREIVTRCQHELIFESLPTAATNLSQAIPRTSSTSYYFLYKKTKFSIEKDYLEKANNIEGIKLLLSNAKDENGYALIKNFAEFLDIDENPYLYVSIKHRSGEFRGKLAFHLLTASTNLGSIYDKRVLFKTIEENI